MTIFGLWSAQTLNLSVKSHLMILEENQNIRMAKTQKLRPIYNFFNLVKITKKSAHTSGSKLPQQRMVWYTCRRFVISSMAWVEISFHGFGGYLNTTKKFSQLSDVFGTANQKCYVVTWRRHSGSVHWYPRPHWRGRCRRGTRRWSPRCSTCPATWWWSWGGRHQHF